MTPRDRLNRNAQIFFRKNAECATYYPPAAVGRSRAGRALAAVAPEGVRVKAIASFNPRLEEVTAFGDPSQLAHAQRVVLKVLECDLLPAKGGAFELRGVRYDVLAVEPRPSLHFRCRVLLGHE